jgi:hypothetical protein
MCQGDGKHRPGYLHSHCYRHFQKSTNIRNLSFQPRVHFWRKRLEWLNAHNHLALPALAFPGPNGAAIHQQSRMQHSAARVNALRILARHHQIAILVAKQIDIKRRQQTNNRISRSASISRWTIALQQRSTFNSEKGVYTLAIKFFVS